MNTFFITFFSFNNVFLLFIYFVLFFSSFIFLSFFSLFIISFLFLFSYLLIFLSLFLSRFDDVVPGDVTPLGLRRNISEQDLPYTYRGGQTTTGHPLILLRRLLHEPCSLISSPSSMAFNKYTKSRSYEQYNTFMSKLLFLEADKITLEILGMQSCLCYVPVAKYLFGTHCLQH